MAYHRHSAATAGKVYIGRCVHRDQQYGPDRPRNLAGEQVQPPLTHEIVCFTPRTLPSPSSAAARLPVARIWKQLIHADAGSTLMTLTKATSVLDRGYRPARELAARATSKHGNPADYAVVCSTEVSSAAESVAARVYSQAYELDDRSHHGDVTIRAVRGPESRIALILDVAPQRESILDHGGFSLKFAPRNAFDWCPRFEGQVRVDHVDAANSRIVAQGRYIGGSTTTLVGEDEDRTAAEDALRQVVALLTTAVGSE